MTASVTNIFTRETVKPEPVEPEQPEQPDGNYIAMQEHPELSDYRDALDDLEASQSESEYQARLSLVVQMVRAYDQTPPA
jgi:hypothetical protein